MKKAALAAFLLLAACVNRPFSDESLRTADRSIRFNALIEEPEAFTGKKVVAGGIIAGVTNRKGESALEVVQFELDSSLFPADGHSGGRFLAVRKKFFDPVVFAKGKAVTVLGEVTGKRTLPVDETEYDYPVIAIRELYLWPENARGEMYLPPPWYPYPYYYDPFIYDPYFYDPFWRPYHPGPYPYAPPVIRERHR